MKTTSIGYASSDGASRIRALLWQPDAHSVAPRGIVQIVHGMAEHIERYAPFAEFLVGEGFVVCANDHVGHGKSVASAEDLGHIPAKGGADVLVADARELRRTVAARYSSAVPYVMFGHSMGSFITRRYITMHGEGLAAAVLCGTGQQPLALSVAGNALARLFAAVRGERTRSSLLDSMGAGAFGKQIEGARTGLDWISTDPAVVDEYIADPACGQMFTVGGYATLTSLTAEVVRAKSAAAVARDLPLLFIAGADDPVGERGAGVRRAVEEYRAAGVETVDEILYGGMRHEILNEPDRERVYADVSAWLARQGI